MRKATVGGATPGRQPRVCKKVSWENQAQWPLFLHGFRFNSCLEFVPWIHLNDVHLIAILLRQTLWYFKTRDEGSHLMIETYVAFPSRRKIQDNENWRVADTTFLDNGLNFNLTSVWVGIGLAYCFILMLLVARAFLRPEGDSCKRKKNNYAV